LLFILELDAAISATNPPYRNITITYNIDSVTANDSGLYECEKGTVKRNFNLRVVGEKTSKNCLIKGVNFLKEQNCQNYYYKTQSFNIYPTCNQ